MGCGAVEDGSDDNFRLFATARDERHNMVSINDHPQQIKSRVLCPYFLPMRLARLSKRPGSSRRYGETKYDVVNGYVAFRSTKGALWSGNSSTG